MVEPVVIVGTVRFAVGGTVVRSWSGGVLVGVVVNVRDVELSVALVRVATQMRYLPKGTATSKLRTVVEDVNDSDPVQLPLQPLSSGVTFTSA